MPSRLVRLWKELFSLFGPRRPAPRRPSLEGLEERSLPASHLTAALQPAGTLYIEGTPRNDLIIVRQFNGSMHVDGLRRWFPAGQVTAIEIKSLGGNDVIDMRTHVRQQPLAVPANVDTVSGWATSMAIKINAHTSQTFGR